MTLCSGLVESGRARKDKIDFFLLVFLMWEFLQVVNAACWDVKPAWWSGEGEGKGRAGVGSVLWPL